jgi:hypothetical protein
MADERILHVCYDPTLLLARERLLIAQGYQVFTVFGVDGLTALSQIDGFDFVLMGDEGPLAERQSSVVWLKEGYPQIPVIALCHGVENLHGSDYKISTVDAQDWIDAVVDCVERCRKSA